MNPRNTWLLVVLAVGLFAYIYFVERRVRPPAPPINRVLSSLDTNATTAIEITSKNPPFTIRVERINGTWQMTQPVVYQVQTNSVDEFLSQLAALTPRLRLSTQDMEASTNARAEYGFDSPNYTILVEQGVNKDLLYLGSLTAPGDEVYAQVPGADGVDVVSADFLRVLPASADSWRDPAFVRWNGQNLDRLAVITGPTSMEFALNPTNRIWRMTGPTPSPANSDKINGLIVQMLRTRVSRFVPTNAADPVALGLEPQPLLQLNLFNGTNQVLALQFGNSTNDNRDEFARAGPGAPIVLVPHADFDEWTNGQNAFRNRNLSLVTADEVFSLTNGFAIDATGANGVSNFAVRCLSNGVYVIDADQNTYPADGDALKAFLINFISLQIAPPYVSNPQAFAVKDRVLDDDLGTFGLAQTNLISRYVLSATPPGSSNVLADLVFGFTNTNAPGTIFTRRAHVPDDRAVYAVSLRDVQNLPARGLDLRLRRIWNFDTTNVVRFIISSDGGVRTLDHAGNYSWPPANIPGSVGITDSAKGFYIEELVENLGQLTAQYWVGPAGPDLTQYGITDKSMRLTLNLNDGSTRTVDFGGPVRGGGRFGAVTLPDGKKWIFVLGPDDWGHFDDWVWRPDQSAPRAVSGSAGG